MTASSKALSVGMVPAHASLPRLKDGYEQMGLEGVVEYWKRKNTISIGDTTTGIFDSNCTPPAYREGSARAF